MLSGASPANGAAKLLFARDLYIRGPTQPVLMSSVPHHRLGIGSSVLSIVRSLGYSVGATLAAAIVGHFLVIATGDASLQSVGGAPGAVADTPALAAFLLGYRLAYLIAAATAFAGAAVSLWAVNAEA